MSSIEKINEETTYDKFYEWHLFLLQMENDVKDASYRRTIEDYSIEWLTKGNDRLKYSQFYSPVIKSDPNQNNQLLIRREYEGGYNPILVLLDEHSIKANNYGSVWTVEFENGESYSALIHNTR